jgi:signal transduction histidine kinase/ActR/RegA family two-component response regulator
MRTLPELTSKELEHIISLMPAPSSLIQVHLRRHQNKFLCYTEDLPALSGMTAAEFADLVKEDALAAILPQDRSKVYKDTKAFILNQESCRGTCSFRLNTKGKTSWIRVRNKVVGTFEGQPVLLCAYLDSSVGKDAMAQIMNASSKIIYIVDKETHELYFANKAALAFWGKPADADYTGVVCHKFIQNHDDICPWCDFKGQDFPATGHREKFFSQNRQTYLTLDWHHQTWHDRDAIIIRAINETATVLKIRELEQAYDNLVESLQKGLTSSPGAFRVNLTQNTCEQLHDLDASLAPLDSIKSADAYLENVANKIADTKIAEEFRHNFTRQKLLQAYARNQHSFNVQYPRYTTGDDFTWLNVDILLTENPHTGDIEAFTFGNDIMDRKKNEAILESLGKNFFDFVGLIDTRHQTIELSTFSRDHKWDVSGTPSSFEHDFLPKLQLLVPEADWPELQKQLHFEEICRSLQNNFRYTVPYNELDEQGLPVRKQLSFSYANNKKRYLIVVKTDIHKSYLQEKENQRQLQKALQQAEEANQAKSMFLANVSHDIRTPLSAIIGLTSLASETNDVVQLKEDLQKIKQAGSLLLELINDTLDLSKIEQGQESVQPVAVDSHHLISDTMDTFKAAAANKGVQLLFDDDHFPAATVSIDKLKLEKILLNLLSNAVKFTPAGGTVTLGARHLEPPQDGCNTLYFVRDTGCGMSPAFIPHMFEPFTQESKAVNRHTKGSGLGLAIVKKLVELLGGHLEVSSKENVGTEFKVYLNLSVVQAASLDPAAAGSAASLAGRTILLCEDHPLNKEIAVRLLAKRQVKVVWAENGQAGVECFQAAPAGTFAAIIMDTMMPVMDGLTAAQTIRRLNHPDARTIPIISLSANAYSEDMHKAKQAGMDACLSKPFIPEELYRTLSQVIANRSKN